MADLNLIIEITREEAERKSCLHAAHCMIYATGSYHHDSLVMMQLREDGQFGFIGGMVEEGESWEQALNRELHEEIGFNYQKHSITPEHYLYTSYFQMNNLCVHFYALPLTLKEYESCERDLHKAKHFGTETMGLIRVPLFTLKRGCGFPMFLLNRFIGNAREQLFRGLKFANILTDEQISRALAESVNMT